MEIYDGLRLMVIGMSTVIAFLCLLVVLMQISAMFFKRYNARFPETVAADAPEPSTSNRDIAIALAAIAHHKSLQKGA